MPSESVNNHHMLRSTSYLRFTLTWCFMLTSHFRRYRILTIENWMFYILRSRYTFTYRWNTALIPWSKFTSDLSYLAGVLRCRCSTCVCTELIVVLRYRCVCNFNVKLYVIHKIAGISGTQSCSPLSAFSHQRACYTSFAYTSANPRCTRFLYKI